MIELEYPLQNNNEKLDVVKFIKFVGRYFNDMFINYNYELIFDPKWNIYIDLKAIETVEDLKCSLLSNLSRPSCKGLPEKRQKYIRDGLNCLLQTNFTQDELRDLIYGKLGYGTNKDLCRKFVKSGYDMKLLID